MFNYENSNCIFNLYIEYEFIIYTNQLGIFSGSVSQEYEVSGKKVYIDQESSNPGMIGKEILCKQFKISDPMVEKELNDNGSRTEYKSWNPYDTVLSKDEYKNFNLYQIKKLRQWIKRKRMFGLSVNLHLQKTVSMLWLISLIIISIIQMIKFLSQEGHHLREC